MLRLTPLRIAVLIGLVMGLMRAAGCKYVELSDARLGDYRLLERGEQTPVPDVVIVAVDDASLDAVGRWPWSRAVMARLVDRLVDAGVAVIGFDIVQSEATAAPDVEHLRDSIQGVDEATWSAVRDALRGGSEDAMLARAVEKSGRTVLGYFFDLDRAADQPTGPIKKYVVGGKKDDEQAAAAGRKHLPPSKVDIPQITPNLPDLNKAAQSLGYFNFIQDGDGYIRRAPLAIRYGDDVAIPLSLAMLQLRLGANLRMSLNETGVASLRLGKSEIPVDSSGQMLVNYRGRRGTFPHLSAADVLNGKIAVDQLKDKLVLVGVTATAVYDLRVTPFAPAFPGVEIHANIIDNILRQQFLYRPWWAKPFEILLVVLLPFGLAGLLHYLRGIWGAFATIVATALYVLISQLLFLSQGLTLTVLYPLATIAVTYSAITAHHYVIEERARRKTRRALELYLSPSLASLVSEHPEELKLGGSKREYTVLFSDVRDFTTISEQLEPETLVELLNAYLGAMTDVIFEHNGMLDKYIGDGIMAVWGAPLPQPDQAVLACRAAFEMMRRMRELEPEWRSRGWPKIDVRIGLNTGPMIFGNMGSAQHMSLTVVGDNVNLGSRLEGLNKLYGTSIIAAESTVQMAQDQLVVRELDLVRVKGRVQPVRIYELMGSVSPADGTAKVVTHMREGLLAYRERRWDDAVAAFRAISSIRPQDGPARLYLERCELLRAKAPPPEWDAVTTMDEK